MSLGARCRNWTKKSGETLAGLSQFFWIYLKFLVRYLKKILFISTSSSFVSKSEGFISNNDESSYYEHKKTEQPRSDCSGFIHLYSEERLRSFFCQKVSYIEGTEIPVTGSHFVKTHLVYELLELKHVVGE